MTGNETTYKGFSDEQDLGDIRISYGFILNGTLADSKKAENLLESLTSSRIVYIKRGLTRLWINEGAPP